MHMYDIIRVYVPIHVAIIIYIRQKYAVCLFVIQPASDFE